MISPLMGSLGEFVFVIFAHANLREGSLMPNEASETPNLLSPGEVAELFRVDPKTVTRWAKAGKLSPVKTLGGHRRYHAHEVHELLRKIQEK
jgi:excisionase family DNA binding protein